MPEERCDRQCQRPYQSPGKSYLTECYYPRADRLCVGLTKAELHKDDLGGIHAAIHLSSLSNDREIDCPDIQISQISHQDSKLIIL